jgi:formate-dependent nitrite reductase membrane component NrfD
MGDAASAVRYIDPGIGTLEGEGSLQRARKPEEHLQRDTPAAWGELPEPDETSPTYYDRPVLKESVWTWDIPVYYYLGGAAGAALTLGAATQLRPGHDLDEFVRHCHWVGVIGSTLGAAFLIHDLGRPMRFLNMMRVFRPTSPMNLGSWVLAWAAPTAITAGLWVRREGPLRYISESAGYASGAIGLTLSTYTGVLVSNTAVPLYIAARHMMPVLFGASAMASAAALLDLVHEGDAGCTITHIAGTAGRIAELIAGEVLERQVSRIESVGRPLHEGVSGALWTASKLLTTASLIVSFLPARVKHRRRIAAGLATAGSLALRFAVHYAGKASARDPRATFDQQRATRS